MTAHAIGGVAAGLAGINTKNAAKKLVRETVAGLSARPRTPNPVLRGSVDIDDDRARAIVRLGDGTVEDALDTCQALVSSVKELQAETAAETRYRQGIVTRSGARLLEVLLDPRRGFDLHSGTNDLAHSDLARFAGISERQVIRAKKQLEDVGLLEWVRRTVKTGLEKLFGVPQQIMVSCRYNISIRRMCPRLAEIYARNLRELRAARARRERRLGLFGQRRPLVRRERPQRRHPSLLNPTGWARAIEAQAKAKAQLAAAYKADEARAIAFAEELARQQSRE